MDRRVLSWPLQGWPLQAWPLWAWMAQTWQALRQRRRRAFQLKPWLMLGVLGSVVGVGCAPTATQAPRLPALNLNGPPPDVVILGVSGHCGPARGCINANDNYDYLTPNGTLGSFAAAVAEAGYSVQVAGYASGAFDKRNSRFSTQPQRGWAALRRDYAAMQSAWAGDLPRVVLVGHSHGVAWTHALAAQFPNQPVAALIDLDGSCLAWMTSYLRDVWALEPDLRGEPDVADICRPRRIEGRWAWGKDIVPPNVVRNLEVQSGHLGDQPTLVDSNYLWEATVNMRPDGSHRGIVTVRSVDDTHSDTSKRESAAVRWAASQLRELAFGWRAADGQ